MAEGDERWCVVTGGRGFAARHLVEMLIQSGEWLVRIADLAPSIKLDPSEEEGVLGDALQSGRAMYVSADLRNKAQVAKACQGAEAVFHMAAPDSSINSYQLHYSVNVEGTKNVIDACIECKVKRLVYTSSPSVVFDGVHGIHNGDESMPYPDKHNDSYSATKAEAEALVIKSNGKNGLLTCCIRPSSIFGPGDKLMVPSIVAAARAGKSKYIIGDGNNMYDFTYVENVAHAHLCAEKALASEDAGAVRAAGQAYFVTNMEPIKFWEFMSLILEGLGYERPRIKIPAPVMMPVAYMVEWVYKMLAPYGMRVPQLIPSRIRLLSCNRTFSCSKAKDQLGYMPIVSLKEGLKRTVESYSHLRAELHVKRRDTDQPSKASIYLGSGKVADTLLWKDKKQTLTTLLALIAIYYHFFTPGYTIITAIAKILMWATLFLFIQSILPAKILGYKLEKIPASWFHFSEEKTRRIALSLGSTWNSAVGVLKAICRGKDWTLFFKVVVILLILNFLGRISFHSIFVTGVPFVFVAFYVYEKREEEIDGLVYQALSFALKLKSDVMRKFVTSKQSAAAQ
ncbi:3beta-hydroxysteroid-dehydrogenase/decarboxylase isoform X1 [Magnolia sinica]|uniref:3beta-hydroxysteroid-dehydrogenase/decarboxylase isoform X1 n=1 Tax=Magnolia sinica TaxID=86752 RepID=UPI0026594B5A|nr:3beta-hydroxysteroid-dehydrogenase/decarboxylase isoform X1 [Magnolia sinica]XP_058108581.1 3beta-hydroxysteroid-dehydrogenase/decarboxylase isoform X1 [Magnolia sinica]XP_058108582.1 3beta-hydroxysteroid-dehydrogenase/decarboxylase isoform X1 [Magnolia sinica]